MSTQETFADKVARLQREIADRQAELAHLVLGDQRTRVTMKVDDSVVVATGGDCLKFDPSKGIYVPFKKEGKSDDD